MRNEVGGTYSAGRNVLTQPASWRRPFQGKGGATLCLLAAWIYLRPPAEAARPVFIPGMRLAQAGNSSEGPLPTKTGHEPASSPATPGSTPPPVTTPSDPSLDPVVVTEPPPLPPLPGATTTDPGMDFAPGPPLPTLPAIEPERFGVVFHGSVRATYDSNIFIQSRNEQEDFIFTIAPGVAIGWGDFKTEIYNTGGYRERNERSFTEAVEDKRFIYLDYVPSVTFFTHHSDENSVDHDINLEGQWVGGKLTIGAKARFQTLNAPDIDLGDRVEQRRFDAAITAAYDISEKTGLEFNLFHNLRNYERASDTREYRNDGWLNYRVQPKLKLSLGYAFGYVDSSEGPHQVFERAMARVRYEANEKLALTATGGVEFRQVGGDDDQTNPVFSLGAIWKPFDGTYFNLNAYSRTQTSASRGQTYVATGFDLLARQRFFQRMYLSLAGGYRHSDYDTLPNGSGARTDDYYYIRPSIGLDITVWLSAELCYEWRSNDSTSPTRSFNEAITYIQFAFLF